MKATDEKKYFVDHYPQTLNVLKKMCASVGIDFDSVDFWDKEDPYYRKHQWTQEQEDDFRSWLTDELISDKELRAEMMRRNTKVKKHCQKCADEFIWNFGWVTII